MGVLLVMDVFGNGVDSDRRNMVWVTCRRTNDGKGKDNDKDRSRSLRDDKQKNKQRQRQALAS